MTGACSENQRENPENKRPRCHVYGPEAQFTTLNGSLINGYLFLFPLLLGKFHNLDGILGRQGDEKNQTYLSIEIQWCPG